jgi:uncharacterized membrane protein
MTFKDDKLFKARVLTGVIVPALVIAGILTLYFYGNPFKCVFYELTGLYCPGCGSGRAAAALIHLKIGQALGYNILFVFLGLPCAIYVCGAYLRFVFGLNVPLPKNIPYPISVTVTVVIILFWILRNIDIYPLTMLAP